MSSVSARTFSTLLPSRFTLLLTGGAVAVAGACTCVWFADPTTPGGPIPVCPTRALLGVTCPGCGSMRMVYSLLHGDVAAAFRFNALAIVGLVLVAWTVVALCLRHYRGVLIPRWEHWRYAPETLGAVFALWMLVRNLPWPPFTGLAV